jgi:hypothetical protein
MKRLKLLLALCAAFAALALFAADAGAHLAYTWSENNNTLGGTGVVKNASEILPDVVVGFGSDIYVFSFKDHNGEWRLLYADETNSSKDDSVFIYDPDDFVHPLRNAASWGTSTHGVASDPNSGYLYLMTYATKNNGGPGGITMVDTRTGYTFIKTVPAVSKIAGDSYYGEAVAVMNGKVYGLYSCRTTGNNFDYDNSIVVEYNPDLTNPREIALIDGVAEAKNTTYMTVHGGSLYIAAMGGYFGPGTLRGGVWKVTPKGSGPSDTVEKLLDVGDLTTEYPSGINATAGINGLEIASNGDMYVMTTTFSSETGTGNPILWKTKVSDPKWTGNKVAGFKGGGNGFLGQAILLDESENILWSPSFARFAGDTDALYAYDISGGGMALKSTFSQLDLNASSAVHRMAVFEGTVTAPPRQEPEGPSGGCDAGLAPLVPAVIAAFALLTRRIALKRRRRS